MFEMIGWKKRNGEWDREEIEVDLQVLVFIAVVVLIFFVNKVYKG